MLSSSAHEEKSLTELRKSLLDVLDAAMAADEASFGNVQVLNRRLGALEIFVQRGFGEDFLHLFQRVRPDDPCVCGRAFRLKQRVVVGNVETDPFFASYLSMAKSVGFRAVQSTPVLNPDGEVIAMLSTHFRKPHSITEAGIRTLSHCAEEAARNLLRF